MGRGGVGRHHHDAVPSPPEEKGFDSRHPNGVLSSSAQRWLVYLHIMSFDGSTVVLH